MAARTIKRCVGSKAAALLASLKGALLPATVAAQQVTCRGDQQVCRLVVAGEQALTSMMTFGDVAPISRIFAADAVWSLGNGKRWTRNEVGP